jgi:GT2 family glycosyltransferase
MDISLAISKEDIESGDAFSLSWLKAHGLKYSFKCTKLVQRKWFAVFMNHITPTRATWNGGNASGWRVDMLAVNGFNEEMRYGGEDREFGERLFNYGIKSIQIRYSAVVLHLDHSRPYKNAEAIRKNEAIRREVRERKIIETPHGIRQH